MPRRWCGFASGGCQESVQDESAARVNSGPRSAEGVGRPPRRLRRAGQPRQPRRVSQRLRAIDALVIDGLLSEPPSLRDLSEMPASSLSIPSAGEEGRASPLSTALLVKNPGGVLVRLS
ncbi:unnamed protein product, partial [Prorocentrum cordatum]